MRNTIIASVCVGFGLAAPAWAQIAVSSNDHKVKQVNGVTSNADNPTPDSITILDLGQSPVKVLGTVDNVPGSVVGPPGGDLRPIFLRSLASPLVVRLSGRAGCRNVLVEVRPRLLARLRSALLSFTRARR